MLRILLVGCALLLLSSAPNRPGPEKTFIRLLKKDQIQELFAGQNEIIVYSSACEELNCDQLPKKIKGKRLLLAGKEELFMRNDPLTLYVDDVFPEDRDWGVSFHIQRGSGARTEVLFRGTYVW